jgi:hypothetical protein
MNKSKKSKLFHIKAKTLNNIYKKKLKIKTARIITIEEKNESWYLITTQWLKMREKRREI